MSYSTASPWSPRPVWPPMGLPVRSVRLPPSPRLTVLQAAGVELGLLLGGVAVVGLLGQESGHRVFGIGQVGVVRLVKPVVVAVGVREGGDSHKGQGKGQEIDRSKHGSFDG